MSLKEILKLFGKALQQIELLEALQLEVFQYLPQKFPRLTSAKSGRPPTDDN